jgi:cyclophilin family peptidyl-prolyl cis-trans isomerase
MRHLLLLLAATVLTAADPAPAPSATRPQVVITTSLGEIRAELYADEAPKTVANFIDLAEGRREYIDGAGAKAKKPFYDGLIFHRVIKGFMIQGGCPLGTGGGDPGYKFADEISAKALGLDTETAIQGDGLNPQCAYMMQQFMMAVLQPAMKEKGITEQTPPDERRKLGELVMADLQKVTLKQFYEKLGYQYDDTLPGSHKPMRGALAMANSGPGTNGSQFFINLGDTPHLAGKHTVFGQVIDGMKVVDAIGEVKVGPGDKPETPVVITSIRMVPAKP